MFPPPLQQSLPRLPALPQLAGATGPPVQERGTQASEMFLGLFS